MELILYTADCVGKTENCMYPNEEVITDAAGIVEAVKHDQVFARYQNDHRSVGNFLSSNVIPMDCDNDHSERPEDWETPENLSEKLQDVDHVIIPSRNHMRDKGKKSARPRMHILFPVQEYTDVDMYTAVKKAIQQKYPFFDDNAVDAARFFFGSDVDEADVIWNEGFLQIDETLDEEDGLEEETEFTEGGPIFEGSRNNTMSRFAGRVLKKYGVCEKARQVFEERAKQCDPPLPDAELDSIWNSAVKFAKKIQNQPGYIPPEQYNLDFDGKSMKPDDYSDLGEAKILAREFGDELLYTSATDLLRYDGVCWREDRQLSLAACLDFMDLQLQDAKDVVEAAEKAMIAAGIPEGDVKGRSKSLQEQCAARKKSKLYFALLGADVYLKFVMKYRNYRNIVNVQNTVKPMVAVDVSELDADPFLLNTPYATYDLREGLAGERPHDPSDMITKVTNVSPGDMGKDIWEEALNTFFCGDRELIHYVKLIVGLVAIGKVYQEHMIVAYGDGSNGKSTLFNVLFRVLGSYAGKISADILTTSCKHNSRPEIAEMKGKRLIIASEMEEGVRLNTAMVKHLCSTDQLQAEKKYRDPFHFDPTHSLILYTNFLARIGSNDDGIWRRLIVIPFNAKITGKSDIKDYTNFLFENAGPAIMAWVIEGAQEAIEKEFHFDIPSVVQDAIDQYREANDWMGQFLEEACERDASYSEKSSELYQQYRMYCMQNGEYTRSTSDFYGALEKAGFTKKRTNAGRMIIGLRLKDGLDFLE